MRLVRSNPSDINFSKLTCNQGHYHSFRNGLHRVADRIVHGSHHHNPEIDVEITSTTSGGSSQAPRSHSVQGGGVPNTITIPTNHVRIGDIVILQGRASQVIKITTSPATGQHRFLGVDLFTKQLHEDSSFISSPSPSVVVQTVLGPVLKQYRVLDLNDGTVVAMTETVSNPYSISNRAMLTIFPG